jgi:hypothetical protein
LEIFEQELFPDLFSMHVEDRNLLDVNPFLDDPLTGTVGLFPEDFDDLQLDPSSIVHQVAESVLAVTTVEYRKSWLTQRIDFERLGWERGVRVLTKVIHFTEKLLHKVHQRKKVNRENCSFCTTQPDARLKFQVTTLIEKAASHEAELNLERSKLD